MYEFKLQIGCLLVVMYVVIFYAKKTWKRQVPCNKIFDTLLYVAPLAIVFDGVTAWTVNHMNVVPNAVNLVCHLMFFLFMDITVIIVYVYVLDMTIGKNSLKNMMILLLPGILSVVGIFLFANELHYIQGKTTWYSMGFSVISCYTSLILHGVLIITLLISHRSEIEKDKRNTLEAFLAVVLAILVIQVLFPESLISSLFPMVAVIGIYVSFEDPSIKRLNLHNEETVTAFATLVENRDDNTGGHIKRTKEYVRIILDEMRKSGRFKENLSEDYIQNVIKAAPMHDIGKIATPDSILQKPGKLTDQEYEIMKQHAARGSEIIDETFSSMGGKEYHRIAYEMARYHHEKWNGKGYPEGLMREQIPLHARIMAIADVFDAVSAKRCYRDALPLEFCFNIIEEGAGVDFDPDLAEIFLNAKKRVQKFYEEEKIKEGETN